MGGQPSRLDARINPYDPLPRKLAGEHSVQYFADRSRTLPGLDDLREAVALAVEFKWTRRLPVPTILRRGPYRFFFYSSDRDEPVHVHVERDDNLAKFWLQPVRLQRNTGFRQAEIIRVARIVEEHRLGILEAWNEYFGG